MGVQDVFASSGEGESGHMVKDHDESMVMTEGNPVEKLIPLLTELLEIFLLCIVRSLCVQIRT